MKKKQYFCTIFRVLWVRMSQYYACIGLNYRGLYVGLRGLIKVMKMNLNYIQKCQRFVKLPARKP